MSDRIAVECSSCGKAFAIAATFAGKKIRCPQCQGIIQVGGGESSPPRTSPTPPARGSSAASTSRPVEPRVARPVRSQSEEQAPAPRRRESSAPPKPNGPGRPAKKKPVENYDDEPWGDLNSEDDGYDPFSPPSAMPPRSSPVKKKGAQTVPAGSTGGKTDGGVIVGILMMVGAVVWFVGGLAFDVIFFYPPILFILGLVATIKGALNVGK